MTPRELIKILEKLDQTKPVVFVYEEFGSPEDSCGYTVVRDVETVREGKLSEVNWQSRSDKVVIALEGSETNL